MDATITTKYQSKALRAAPALRADIRRGRFGTDCVLPKETDLAELYGVSRSTVRRMLSILEAEGELRREPRKRIRLEVKDATLEPPLWNGVSQVSRTADPGAPGFSSYGSIDGRATEHMTVCAMIQSDCLVPLQENGLLADNLPGMSEAALERDVSLLINYVPYKYRDRADSADILPPAVRNGTVDGIILIHHYPQDVAARFAVAYPCVSLMYDYNLPNMDVIDGDNIESVGQLLRGLYRRGHRKIVFAGRIRACGIARLRLAGFLKGEIELGIPCDQTNDIFDFSELGDAETFRQLRERVRQGITAVVCSDDLIGYMVLSKLKDAGVSVPREVSVTGFDVLHPPQGLPRLTSIRVPAVQIGAAAVAAVLERRRNPGAPAKKIILKNTLIEGETVADVKI